MYKSLLYKQKKIFLQNLQQVNYLNILFYLTIKLSLKIQKEYYQKDCNFSHKQNNYRSLKLIKIVLTLYKILTKKYHLIHSFSMSNTQQLFEINKRINQIKRNLQSRQQRANEWSVPYQKILQKNNHSNNNDFRNSYNANLQNPNKITEEDFYTKTQRKQFYQKKVKESRKKIKQYHNQLKQLQQLLERKTKLYVKKQESVPNQNEEINNKKKYNSQKHKQKQNFDLNNMKNSSFIPTNFPKSTTTKPIMSKTFNGSIIFMNIINKGVSKNPSSNIRTIKDRINPFVGFKVQKMIQLYQDIKNSGNEHTLNQTIGIGIDHTPYMNLMRKEGRKLEEKEEEINDNKKNNSMSKDLIHGIESTISLKKTTSKHYSPKQSLQFYIQPQNIANVKRNLPKMMQEKISQKKQIYLNSPLKKRLTTFQRSSSSFKNKKLSVFQTRLKRLLEETQHMNAQDNKYLQIIKRAKTQIKSNTNGKYNKTTIGFFSQLDYLYQNKNIFLNTMTDKNKIQRIRANKPYKTILEM